MAKCSRINITAKQETTVKTLQNNKIIKLQLLKQQTNDKIVERYCKQRN